MKLNLLSEPKIFSKLKCINERVDENAVMKCIALHANLKINKKYLDVFGGPLIADQNS